MSKFQALAIIPARGGSKGIPRKNLQEVGGKSLIGRCVSSLSLALGTGAVFVSTDDTEIASETLRHGGGVIDRPKDISGDTASSEAAILHAFHVLETKGQKPKVLVFAQCTSPFIDPDEVKHAVEQVTSGKYDVMFSAVQSHAFIWKKTPDGRMEGINHTHLKPRLRRQDMEPQYRETGAFYVMKADGFMQTKNRFFGRIGVIESQMPHFEIDNPDDLILAKVLTTQYAPRDEQKLSNVKLLVMDFDGVHTDDTVLVLPDGSEAVICSRRDGMGLELLRKAGYKLLILSKEKNTIVQKRAEKLEIPHLNSVEDKEKVLTRWLIQNNLSWDETAYIGNDINDLSCMRKAGVSFCPSDAHPDAKYEAKWILDCGGGAGALRETADLLINKQNGREEK